MNRIRRTSFSRAWHQLDRRRKLQLCLLVVLMLAAAVVEVFSIGAVIPLLGVLSAPEKAFAHPMMRPLVDALQITNARDLVLPVSVIFAIGAIASGVFRYQLLRAQTRITYSIGIDLSVRIFERTLYQPYSVHVARNSSEVIAGVSNKANDLIVGLLYPAAILVSSIIMLLIVLVALILVEPTVTIATLAAFALFYALTSLVSRGQLRESGRIINKQYSNVIRLIQEGLGGIRDILLDGTQRTFVDNYRLSETELRNSRATVQIMSGTPRFIIETLGILFLTALAYTLSTGSDGLNSSIPVLGVVALALQRLVPVMQQLYFSWANIAGSSASVHGALEFLEQPMPRSPEVGRTAILPFESHIRLENVSFSYGAGLPSVLRNVNLDIPKGAKLGIIGETGSGKSTFLDVVMGLVMPTQGFVTVDGVRLDESNIRQWQGNIAHVPQAIYLADSSIAENIAFGEPPDEIDLDRVIAASITAQIHDVIQGLPDGMATLVGERGVRLSGGQRQRIGIARALYKQATVIILDEATSALDRETEQSVMDAVHALPAKITLLIVAHRHSTLHDCTSVIRIGNGEVVGVDNFADVLAGRAGSVAI